jgi:hypothetical protein
MDRQKLSKVVLEHLRKREHESTGWKNEARLRLSRVWGRFGALSLWEKGIISGAAVLIVIGLPAAIFAFSTGGGGSDDTQVVAPASDRDEDPYVLPTSTPYDRPNATPKPIGVGGSPPIPTLSPEEINREDCDAIAGTPYQSEEERLWFIANCPEDDEDDDDPGNVTNPPTQPPVVQPTQAPPPPPPPTDDSLTASEAAAMAAQFLGVGTGACSASSAGAHWRVTCSVGGSAVTVCVFEQPLLVDYC